MKYNYKTLITCQKPNIIFNRYTQKFEKVPCKTCEACKYKAGQLKSKKIEAELKNWEHCIFFTLTYNNNSLPKIRIKVSKQGIRLIPLGRVNNIRYVRLWPEKDYIYDKKSNKNWRLRTTIKTIEKEIDEIPTYTGNTKPDEIAVIYYRDIQLFKKKLRKQLIKKYGKIKYTITCTAEYGEERKRPHYHLLFMYDGGDIATLKEFKDIVRNCWGERKRIKGHGSNKFAYKQYQDDILYTDEESISATSENKPNFSWVAKNSNVKQYVSEYINSNVNMPKLLRIRPWQQRCYLGKGKYEVYGTQRTDESEIITKTKEVYNNTRKNRSLDELFRRKIKYFNKKTNTIDEFTAKYASNLYNKLFPKPYGYRETNDANNKLLLKSFKNEIEKRNLRKKEINKFLKDEKKIEKPQDRRYVINAITTIKRWSLTVNEYVEIERLLYNYIMQQLKLKDMYDDEENIIKETKTKLSTQQIYSNINFKKEIKADEQNKMNENLVQANRTIVNVNEYYNYDRKTRKFYLKIEKYKEMDKANKFAEEKENEIEDKIFQKSYKHKKGQLNYM